MKNKKCRMWDGRVNKYFYDPEIVFECLKQQMCGTYDHESEGVVFEWYTGMTDKNNTEIYQNEIVVTNDNNDERGIIVWDDEECELSILCSTFCTKLGSFYGKEIESIGNIHDNPELLEV